MCWCLSLRGDARGKRGYNFAGSQATLAEGDKHEHTGMRHAHVLKVALYHPKLTPFSLRSAYQSLALETINLDFRRGIKSPEMHCDKWSTLYDDQVIGCVLSVLFSPAHVMLESWPHPGWRASPDQ
jgi:hypothetical protein